MSRRRSPRADRSWPPPEDAEVSPSLLACPCLWPCPCPCLCRSPWERPWPFEPAVSILHFGPRCPKTCSPSSDLLDIRRGLSRCSLLDGSACPRPLPSQWMVRKTVGGSQVHPRRRVDLFLDECLEVLAEYGRWSTDPSSERERRPRPRSVRCSLGLSTCYVNPLRSWNECWFALDVESRRASFRGR